MRIEDRPPPYRTVVFDCDSTLSAMEGIEELAGERGEALASMTREAMEGRLALEEVYGRRLAIVRPTRADVERIARLYVERRLAGAEILVAALRFFDKRVRIVSGGLRPAVLALGRSLGIDGKDVEAVDLAWDGEGRYAGFDESSPLARSGGKSAVLESIRTEPGAIPIALVGDGATDLEAAHRVERFIAFGGVERRAEVFAAARVRCDEPDLAALLPLLLDEDELAALRREPRFAPHLPPAP